MHRLTPPDRRLSPAPVDECDFPACRLSSCHSVFVRTLPRYLTLSLRRAPTCHGNGREPDELTEHHRAGSSQRTALQPFIPFCEVMNKE